jgi:hypothetical protein
MDATLRRLAPLTGIGFVVLSVFAIIIGLSDSPDFAASEREIVDFYADNKDEILIATIAITVSAPFYIWFLGCVRSAIARAEGGTTRLASTAFGAGVASLALWLAGWLINAMGALRLDENDTIGAQTATAYWDIGQILAFAAVGAAAAGLLAATAIASLRYKAILPAWLAYITIVIAIVDVIPFISFIGIFLGLLWILVVSVMLYVQRVGEGDAPAAAAPPPPAAPAPPPPGSTP